MFAPILFQLSVELVTNLLVVLNNIVLAIAQQGSTNLFPPPGMWDKKKDRLRLIFFCLFFLKNERPTVVVAGLDTILERTQWRNFLVKGSQKLMMLTVSRALLQLAQVWPAGGCFSNKTKAMMPAESPKLRQNIPNQSKPMSIAFSSFSRPSNLIIKWQKLAIDMAMSTSAMAWFNDTTISFRWLTRCGTQNEKTRVSDIIQQYNNLSRF